MNRLRLGSGVLASLVAASAGAVNLEYGVGLGTGQTDNILRTPDNEQEETLALANLELRMQEANPRLDADVDVDLTYYDYRENTYENDVSGMAIADLRFKLIQERLAWVIEESFGQASLDPFAAQTPENIENVNFFTTGPELTARLGADAHLTLLGRYSFSRYEESEFDDQRLLAGASLGRDLAGGGLASFNMTSERVEFDDLTFGSHYDRHSVFVRYEVDNARTRLGAQGGYTETHDQGDTDGSPLIEVDVVRDISDRSTLSLRGGIRSSDAAASLRAGNIAGGGAGSSPHPVSSSGLFETRHVTLGWQVTGRRTEVSLSGGYVKDAYTRESGLDRSRSFFRASLVRHLTPRVSAEVRGLVYSNDYEAITQEDDESQYALQLSWNVSGRFYVELVGEMIERDSTNPLTEFEEQRAFLRLAWRDVIGRRAPDAGSVP